MIEYRIEGGQKIKYQHTLFRYSNHYLMNSIVPRSMKEGDGIPTGSLSQSKRGDMAKLVDATDLIGLSLGMETC